MDYAVIDRNSTDHGRTFAGKFLAERLGIAVGRQVHDCFGAHIHSGHHFLHFNIIIFAVTGNPKVHIDLGAEHRADTIRVDTGM